MADVRLTVKVESTSEVVREYSADHMVRTRTKAVPGAGTTVSIANIPTPAMIRVVSEAADGEIISVEHATSLDPAVVHLAPGEVYVTEDVDGNDVVVKSNTGEPLFDFLAVGS